MIGTSAKSGWTAATPLGKDAMSPWGATSSADSGSKGKWATGDRASHSNSLPWDATLTVDVSSVQPHDTSAPEDTSTSSVWEVTKGADQGSTAKWGITWVRADVQLKAIYNPNPGKKDVNLLAGFYRVDEYLTRPDAAQLTIGSLYNPTQGAALDFNFRGRSYNPESSPFVYFQFEYEPPASRAYSTDSKQTRVRNGIARQFGTSYRIPWGTATPTDGKLTTIRYPDYTGPVVIPEPDIPEDPEILEAYMIGNLVTVTDVDSGEPIMASNLSMTLDADSFSWALTMDVLNRSSMDLVRPTSATPKQVVIDINGHVWTFLIEKYRRNFKFPTEAYSVTGSSRMQLLAEPYATPVSGVNTGDISANQIIDAMLLNTGFSCVWEKGGDGNVPDWVVPAGAFTYVNQTPMQLVARVASVIGAIARPYASGDVIEIIPRYLVPYWQWSPLTAHKIIPSAIMTSLGGDWVPSPDWNSCYVSGVNHGVGVLVTRAGTSGHLAAPDVLDDLLTDSTANTYRGRVELSKGGSKELVSLQIPLFQKGKADTPGLVLPGMLCDVREGDNWIGLCLGTAIQASGVGASLVTQNLKLERHTSEIT